MSEDDDIPGDDLDNLFHEATGDDDDVADDDVSELSAREQHKAWRRTERERRRAANKSVRFPILTRSIMLWWLIFALVGLAGGATAAYFWTHFNDEIRVLKEENANLQETIDAAKADIESQRTDALGEIGQALKPLETLALESQSITLAGEVSESVWFVNTLDFEGKPSVGTAFVVSSNETESLLVTSFDVVKEAVIVPGPLVTLTHGTEQFVADVYSWDIERDLAVLVIPRPDLPPLEWASEEQAATALGARVFVLGALGGSGATAVPGLVLDQSAQGIQVDAPVGTAFRGGPIVTADRQVLAVASTAYAPLGFDPGNLRFSVSIGGACTTILNCGGGVRNKGPEGGPAPEPPPGAGVPAPPPPN